jgi:predicted HD superfamily hydrolase involved in NAD metabolism
MADALRARAEDLLAARLSPEGLAHCRAVAEMAEKLAAIYDVDVETAGLAGLLHDWDREVPRDALADRAVEAGIAATDLEVAAPYLLHARTGAQAVRDVLAELSPQVVRAIELHTVGDPRMGDLDMVVYLADMLSTDRNYPGVGALRELVGAVSLEELFAECYRHSIADLVERRKPIHPMTVEVYNAFVARRRS